MKVIQSWSAAVAAGSAPTTTLEEVRENKKSESDDVNIFYNFLSALVQGVLLMLVVLTSSHSLSNTSRRFALRALLLAS